jgi:hypothetical protein
MNAEENAEKLATGYQAYATADEVAHTSADDRDAAESPTTSIFTTVCIHGW